MIEVITNIDADHMDTYDHDFARLKQAFVEFTQRLPFYGIAVLCVDDPNVREILPFVSKPIITLRLRTQMRRCARSTSQARGRQDAFHARCSEDAPPLDIVLNLPGMHNVQNALRRDRDRDRTRSGRCRHPAGAGANSTAWAGASSATAKCASPTAAARSRWSTTTAITRSKWRRRWRRRAAPFPGRRLVLAFQPHRYTRTRDCSRIS